MKGLTTILLASSTSITAKSVGIPQHRVKTSTRVLDYGASHPLSRYSNPAEKNGDVTSSRVLEEEEWIPFVDSANEELKVEGGTGGGSSHLRTGKVLESESKVKEHDDVTNLTSEEDGAAAASSAATAEEETFENGEQAWSISTVPDKTLEERRAAEVEAMEEELEMSNFWRGETSSPLPPPHYHGGTHNDKWGEKLEDERRRKMRLGDGGEKKEGEKYVLWENEVVEEGDGYALGVEVETEPEEENVTDQENRTENNGSDNETLSENGNNTITTQEIIEEVEDEDRVNDLLTLDSIVNETLVDTTRHNDTAANITGNETIIIGGADNSLYPDSPSDPNNPTEQSDTSDFFIPSDRNSPSGGIGENDLNDKNSTKNNTETTDYTTLFDSMRIKTFLGDESGAGKFLSREEKEILLNDIIQPAIKAWSDALRVVPIRGNLTVDQSQLFDGISCGPGVDSGLPSVIVPGEHMGAGIENADLVLYLSLGFQLPEKPKEEVEEVWERDKQFETVPRPQNSNDSPLWGFEDTAGAANSLGDSGESVELSSFLNASSSNHSSYNSSIQEENPIRCRPVSVEHGGNSSLGLNETINGTNTGNTTNVTIIGNYTDSNSSSWWNETDFNETIIESNGTNTSSSNVNSTEYNNTYTGEEGTGSNSTIGANATEIITNNSTDTGSNGTINTSNSIDNSTAVSNATTTIATTGPATTNLPNSNSSSLGNETDSSMGIVTIATTTGPSHHGSNASIMDNSATTTVATTQGPSSTSPGEQGSSKSNITTTNPTAGPYSTTKSSVTTDATETADVPSSRNGGSYATYSTKSTTTSATVAQEPNSTDKINETVSSSTPVPVSTSMSVQTSSQASANAATIGPTVVSNGNSSLSEEKNGATTYPTTTVSVSYSTTDSNSAVTSSSTATVATVAIVASNFNSSGASSITTNDTITGPTVAIDSNSSIASNDTTAGSTVATVSSNATIDSKSSITLNATTITSPTAATDSNSSNVSNDTVTGPTVATDSNSSLSEEGLNSTTDSTQVPDNSSSASNITTTNPTLINDFNSSDSLEYNSSDLVNGTYNGTTNSSNSSFPEDTNSTDEIVYQEDDSDLPPCKVTDEPSSYPTLQPSSFPSTHPSSLPSTAPSSAPTEEQPPPCLGEYLASATYCSTDQFDRPVAGMMNICIGDDFFQAENLHRNIITVIHEIGHVLGFNPVSLAHFRARDGTPLTPRDQNGDVPDVDVECTGPSEGRIVDTIPLPSDSILQFQDVRGGVRVANVVTPTVAQVVRNQFDCQKLDGGELESPYSYGEDAEVRECIGGHWSRRLFATDIMNPNVATVEFTHNISPLTLAMMADTGWYQVDLAHAAFVSTWGRRAGCDFVEDKCVSGDGGVTAPNAPFFCNDVLSSGPEETINEIHGCTADLSRKAVCSIVRYNEDLPDEYDYFGDVFGMGSKVGGSDPGLDFCPAFSGFSNGLCKDGENEKFLSVHSMEEFGQRNSRCVVGQVDNTRTALCLPIACVIADRTLRVKVDGYWKVCRFQGQIISGWWDDNDYIVCPDPSRICPTFYCPRNCLGTNGGVCDYETGKCMCESTDPIEWQLDGDTTKRLVPCDENNNYNWHFKGTVENDLSRAESSLSEYYVTNSKVLKDNSKDIFDEVSRAFTKMSTGDAIVFVTSCVVAFFFVWFFVWRMRWFWKKLAYKLKPSFFWLASWFFRKRLCDERAQQPHDANRSRGRSSQKDKMVASLVVDLRVNDPVVLERFRVGRKHSRASRNLVQKNSERIVYQSELPPLPENGGRVVAVVGSEFIQDGAAGLPGRIADDEVSIGQTEATITTTSASVAGSTDEESIAQYSDLCFSIEEYTPQNHDLRRRPVNSRARPTDLTTYLEGGKTTGLDT